MKQRKENLIHITFEYEITFVTLDFPVNLVTSDDDSSSPPVSKQQLYSVCKSMQTRVVELIPQLLDEGFIEELLVVNDDLNNAFIRYERCTAAKLLVLDYKKM